MKKLFHNKYFYIIFLMILVTNILVMNHLYFLFVLLCSIILLISYFLEKKTVYDLNDKINELSNNVEKRSVDIAKREHMLSNFFNGINLPICIFDRKNFKFKDVNPCLCSLLKYSKEELLNTPIENIIHPNDLKGSKEASDQALIGKNSGKFVNRYISKDATIVTLEWESSYEKDDIVYVIAKEIKL